MIDDIVEVSWIDASFVIDGPPPLPYVVTTYGILIERTSEYLRVASEDIGDNEYRAITTIPDSSVLGVRSLTVMPR